MAIWFSLVFIIIISIISYFVIKHKIIKETTPQRKAAAPARFYGYSASLWCLIAGITSTVYAKYFTGNFPETIIPYFGVNVSFGILVLIIILIRRSFKARQHVEGWVKLLIFSISLISVLITLGITAIIFLQTISFLKYVSIFDFLFRSNWQPQNYEMDIKNSFGMLPVFLGTIYITFISLIFAAPLGIFSAIYVSEFMTKKMRAIIKPSIEMLASIPSVVYGYFASFYIGPFIKDIATFLGFSSSTENALAAGLMIGVMILPLIMTMSDDVISSIPKALRDASLALGATHIETLRKVILPAAKPGIICAILIALSRAIGETMIVTMAAGFNAKLTLNPFDSLTTITVQIVSLMTGDENFDSPKTLSAFGLASILFIFTVTINFISNKVIVVYKRKYGNFS
ncbi:MAG: phosphate ABC transporter permease subunit PstC [Sphingobacteriia bacterium]|nr:phosphate ABC transporter permease subunit PstC [Sphingobacteriia bacterium]